jgi:hypothetical protein
MNNTVNHTDPAWHEKPKHVLHFLSSLYRPDDDLDKGRNILAKAKYIYTWYRVVSDGHYTDT